MWKKEENSKNWWYIDIMESKFAMGIKYYSAPPYCSINLEPCGSLLRLDCHE